MPIVPFSASLALLMPMAGVITQQVRPGHPAIDIACLPGTPVHAAHDGQGRSHWDPNLGLTFVLEDGRGLQTLYAHLNQASPAGAYTRGSVIGACGNTGRLTTGPHLHFGSNQPTRLLTLLERDDLQVVPAPAPIATRPIAGESASF